MRIAVSSVGCQPLVQTHPINPNVFSALRITTDFAPPRSSEIAVRFLKHDFGAENPNVLWESRSIGRSPLKWLESQRIIPIISATSVMSARITAEARHLHLVWVA
jgi:hypothetical protein